MRRDCCIYKIINTTNSKIYVGSAIYFAGRKGLHLFELRNNKHKNRHLQASFNKYGESSFIFERLEDLTNENLLIEREQYYIDTLKPQYNINPVAGSRLNTINNNRRFTKEQVEEIVKLKSQGCKNIEIAKKFNIDNSNISRLLNGRFYRDIIKEEKPRFDNRPNKLKLEDKLEIYKRILKGDLQADIAKDYNVNRSVISRIKTKYK